MKSRSPWHWVDTWPNESIVPVESQVFTRNVGDGSLYGVVSFDSEKGWRLDLICRCKGTGRYPTWEETLDAAQQLLPRELEFFADVGESATADVHSIHIIQYPGVEENE